MFGIELTEVLLLGKQLGLAVAGAAALWGFVFGIKGSRSQDEVGREVYSWITEKLLLLFTGGLVTATISYLVLLSIFPAEAHEGITVAPTTAEIAASFQILSPLFLIMLFLTLVIYALKTSKTKKFPNYITRFFLISFVLSFLMTSFGAWRGGFDTIQTFFIAHGFHSIFTIGSVIVLDYLFLVSEKSNLLKKHIFTLFPTISKVIWTGLAFDLLSALLIVNNFVPTQKFLFAQTVIGILILNGVLLSGPIARKMISTIKSDGEEMSKKWWTTASIAGSISIASWMTITSIDFFEHLTLNYWSLFALYLLFIIVVYSTHSVMEMVRKKTEPSLPF